MKNKLNKQEEERMSKEQIDDLINLHINRAVDAIIEEISEIDKIPVEDVIGTHKIAIVKGLFIAREENEMYSDMANLKESIEKVVEEKDLEDKDALKKATSIVDLFEDYLYEKGVKIENSEREDEYSAIIYGKDYYSLEDKILEIIKR